MSEISYIPAFGLETDRWNADGHRKSERADAKWQGTIFETGNYVKANCTKYQGWTPIYGSWIGYQRLSEICNTDPKVLTNRGWHIFRGVIELLSLGFLLIIPDLIITFFKSCCCLESAVV